MSATAVGGPTPYQGTDKLLSLKPQLKPFIQPETLASYGFGVDQGSHPMGESRLKRSRAEEMPASCAGVQTAGGRVQVRWDADGAATPMGLACSPSFCRSLVARGGR